MSISVETLADALRKYSNCAAGNKSCTKEATLIAYVGETAAVCLCLSCARELFNALGFIIVSQTGESIERLVGVSGTMLIQLADAAMLTRGDAVRIVFVDRKHVQLEDLERALFGEAEALKATEMPEEQPS